MPGVAAVELQDDPPQHRGGHRERDHQREPPCPLRPRRPAAERRVHGERERQDQARVLQPRQQREEQSEPDHPPAPVLTRRQRDHQADREQHDHEPFARDHEHHDRQRRRDRHRDRGQHALHAVLQEGREQPLDGRGQPGEQEHAHDVLRARVLAERGKEQRRQPVHQRRVHARADPVRDQPAQPVAVKHDRLAQRDHRVEVRRLADEPQQLDRVPREHHADRGQRRRGQRHTAPRGALLLHRPGLGDHGRDRNRARRRQRARITTRRAPSPRAGPRCARPPWRDTARGRPLRRGRGRARAESVKRHPR